MMKIILLIIVFISLSYAQDCNVYTGITFDECTSRSTIAVCEDGSGGFYPNSITEDPVIHINGAERGRLDFFGDIGIGGDATTAPTNVPGLLIYQEEDTVNEIDEDLLISNGNTFESALQTKLTKVNDSFYSLKSCAGDVDEQDVNCDDLLGNTHLYEGIHTNGNFQSEDWFNNPGSDVFVGLDNKNYFSFGTIDPRRYEFGYFSDDDDDVGSDDDDQFGSGRVVIIRTDKDGEGSWDFVEIPGRGNPSFAQGRDENQTFYALSVSSEGNNGFGQLLLHSNCGFTTSRRCDFNALTGSDAFLPNAQLLIDDENNFHYIGYTQSGNTLRLVYQRCIEGTDSSCVGTIIWSGNANELTDDQILSSRHTAHINYPFLKASFNRANDDGHITGIVVHTVTTNRGQSQSKSQAIFNIYECDFGNMQDVDYFDGFGNYDDNELLQCATVSTIPRNNDKLKIPHTIDFWDVAYDSFSGESAYVYAYRNGRTQDDKSTRSETADAADDSMESYSFRYIYCPNEKCDTYTTTEVIGARELWEKSAAAIPRGVKISMNKDSNNGWPTIAFAVGAQSDIHFGSQLHNTAMIGGTVGLIHCFDNNCSNAQLSKTPDQTSGHVGEFALLQSSDSVTVASPQLRGNHWSPVMVRYSNSWASSTTKPCNQDTVGILTVVDNEVFVCSKIESSATKGHTTLYYNTSIRPNIRNAVTRPPVSVLTGHYVTSYASTTPELSNLYEQTDYLPDYYNYYRGSVNYPVGENYFGSVGANYP